VVERHTQRIVLLTAIALTAAAIARVGIWRPLTPRPAELDPTLLAPLQHTAWTIRSRPNASDGAAVSSARGFELVNGERHPGVVVTLAPVRAIGANSYSIEALMAPVVGRRAGTTTVLRFGEHERVRIHPRQQSPASQAERLEAACLSNGVVMASTQRLVTTELAHDAVTTHRQRLAQLLGLRQARNWDCLLVAVRQPAETARSSGLIWAELVAQLRSWDQERS
jgi:hypothetical protein